MLHVHSYRIRFLQNGRLFGQYPWDFVEELRLFPIFEGARRARGMVVLAEIEMAFIMAFASGTSLPAFFAVMGVNVTQALEGLNVPRLAGQISALLAARAVLKRHAPTFYSAVFDEFVREVGSNIFDLDSWSLEDAAALAGALLAKAGGYQRLASKLSVVWKAASAAVTVALAAAKAGAKGAVADLRDRDALMAKLQKAGLKITRADAAVLPRELENLRAHEGELRKILDRLESAFGR